MTQHREQTGRNLSRWRRVGIGCSVVALAATGVISAQADPAPPSGQTFPAKAAIDGRDRPTNDARRTTDVYLPGDQVQVKCQTEGDEVGGSRLWIYTDKKVYIPDYLVKTGTDGFIPGVPKCNGGENPPAPQEQPAPPEESPAPPAEKAKPRVVAMGDSYASGEGTFGYDAGTDVKGVNECHRSPRSWQRNVNLPGLGMSSAANSGIDYQQVACSGAVSDNILKDGQWGEPKQLDALKGNEDYVLLSIGGNDLGFADIVRDCLLLEDCYKMDNGLSLDYRVTKFASHDGTLARTIRAIHQKSKGAKIVLAGYPELFGQPRPWVKGCTGISSNEGSRIDRVSNHLRGATARRVKALQSDEGINVRYAATTTEFAGGGLPFSGHGACTGLKRQWINSLQGPITREGIGQHPEMFHPNEKGQQAYVRAVQKVL